MDINEFYQRVKELFPEAGSYSVGVSMWDGVRLLWSASAYREAECKGGAIASEVVRNSPERVLEELAKQRALIPLVINDPEEVMG